MPDISKCDATLFKDSDELCPLRTECYRYLVKPNIIQIETRFGYAFNKQDNTCDYFRNTNSE